MSERRKNDCGHSVMYNCWFNVLHYAGDMELLAIIYRIHIHLDCFVQILINQEVVLGVGFQNTFHIRLKLIRLDGEDRKSTRLNSSHVAISYAVFCLKKKTTRIQ